MSAPSERELRPVLLTELEGEEDEPEERAIELVLDEAQDGLRLDRALAARLPDQSRAQIQKHIELGAVTVDGEHPRKGTKTPVRAGQRVRYLPPPPEIQELEPEPIPLSVIYEDEYILVVDKQAGLVVHPALGHPRGTLVNAVLHHTGQTPGGERVRPGIVHRLDRGTTGLIAIAKSERAHARLVDSFRDRRVEKRYIGVTLGVPAPAKDTIDTPYGRHPRDRKRFSSRVREGKRAITHYAVDEIYPGAALVSVILETGRTHQIRVHLADRGWPLIGDDTYGKKKPRDPRVLRAITGFDRPALHARALVLPHPITGERLSLEAPLPEDLSRLIDNLRGLR